ncbi:MAG: hypothetical protein J0L62_17425, partial [Bacteroidetes bacterium]|nr:hypothetical protein [Bacteroidota bacterium]
MKLVISVLLLCLHVSLFAQPTTLLQEDFETGELNPAWTINNTGDNGWLIGTDTALSGTYSAYISNIASEGLYTYNPNANSTALLRAPITIPAGQPILKVSLTWKGKGEPGWDDLRIKLQAIELVEPAKIARLSPAFITYKWLSGSEQPNKTTIYFNTGISDSTVNLVFEWRNDDCCWFGETESQAPQPAMIDDILVESFEIVPMSGTYTVGAEGDFPTLDDAFSALYAFKASADVTLELLDTVYDGPVRIYGSFQNGETETWVSVIPAFEVNPVFKFTSHYFYQGEPGDYPSVIIIENTDHINFGGISVDYTLGAPGGIQILDSDYITISECSFYGQDAVYTNKWVYSSGIRIGDSNGYFDGGMGGGGGEVLTFSGKPNWNRMLRPYTPKLGKTAASTYYNNLAITMNEFNGGNFGIYAAGNPVAPPIEVAAGALSPNHPESEFSTEEQIPEMSYLNTSVNMLFGQYIGGIHVEKYENLQLNYNVIFSGFVEFSAGTFGVSMGNSNGIILPARINPVQNLTGTFQGSSSITGKSKLGSLLPKFQGLVEKIKANPKAILRKIKVLAEKSSGLRKIQEGNSNQMINNILLNISTGSNGLSANIWLKSVSNLDIFHNSMAFMSEDTTLAALLIEGETFNSSIKNNLFYGGPNPLFKSAFSLPDMDYNVFFNESPIIGIVTDSVLVTMEDLQSYTSTNLNSHFFEPLLTGEDLSPDPSLYGNPNMIGTPLGVESDYWGNPRDAEFPTIGAHELSETVPVELVSFSGVNRSGQILLFWETKTETNNYGWEVERQKLEDRSEKLEWETIGFVAGKGTATESHSYSFSSPVPGLLSPAVYRLKQIDLDGKFTYSRVVEVSSEPLVFSLEQNFPNPFNPSTSIRF